MLKLALTAPLFPFLAMGYSRDTVTVGGATYSLIDAATEDIVLEADFFESNRGVYGCMADKSDQELRDMGSSRSEVNGLGMKKVGSKWGDWLPANEKFKIGDCIHYGDDNSYGYPYRGVEQD